MAVELTATSANFIGTGVSSTYAAPIYANSAAQVQVSVNGVLQTLGDNYVLNDVGSPNGINIVATFPSGAAIFLERVTAIKQQVDTQNNETILEDVLDSTFDKLTMIDQEQQGQIGRTLQVPRGEVGVELPAAADRAGLFFRGTPTGGIGLSSGTGNDPDLRMDLAQPDGTDNIGTKYPALAAVVRTQLERNADRVNVMDFGAVGGGVVNDTAAFQAANDYLASRGGGTIDVPAGAFKVQTINRSDSVVILGAHRRGTRLIAPAGYNAPMIQAISTIDVGTSRGGVQSLALIGSGMIPGMVGIKEAFANRTTHRDLDLFGFYEGMYLENSWQIRWDNVHVHGAGTDQSRTGFRLGPKDPTLGISNAVVATGCMAQGVAYCGFRLENYDGAKFESCEANNGDYGWFLGSPSTGTEACQFGHFSLCLGDTNGINNWRLDKGNATDIRQPTFSGCWGGSAGADGFYIGGASQISICGGEIVNSAEHGFNVQLSSRIAITGLIIRDYASLPNRNGVCINDSQAVTLGNNQIYTAKNAPPGPGVREYGVSNYNSVVGGTSLGGVQLIGANSQSYAVLDY